MSSDVNAVTYTPPVTVYISASVILPANQPATVSLATALHYQRINKAVNGGGAIVFDIPPGTLADRRVYVPYPNHDFTLTTSGGLATTYNSTMSIFTSYAVADALQQGAGGSVNFPTSSYSTETAITKTTYGSSMNEAYKVAAYFLGTGVGVGYNYTNQSVNIKLNNVLGNNASYVDPVTGNTVNALTSFRLNNGVANYTPSNSLTLPPPVVLPPPPPPLPYDADNPQLTNWANWDEDSGVHLMNTTYWTWYSGQRDEWGRKYESSVEHPAQWKFIPIPHNVEAYYGLGLTNTWDSSEYRREFYKQKTWTSLGGVACSGYIYPDLGFWKGSLNGSGNNWYPITGAGSYDCPSVTQADMLVTGSQSAYTTSFHHTNCQEPPIYVDTNSARTNTYFQISNYTQAIFTYLDYECSGTYNNDPNRIPPQPGGTNTWADQTNPIYKGEYPRDVYLVGMYAPNGTGKLYYQEGAIATIPKSESHPDYATTSSRLLLWSGANKLPMMADYYSSTVGGDADPANFSVNENTYWFDGLPRYAKLSDDIPSDPTGIATADLWNSLYSMNLVVADSWGLISVFSYPVSIVNGIKSGNGVTSSDIYRSGVGSGTQWYGFKAIQEVYQKRNLTERLENEIKAVMPLFTTNHPTLKIGFATNLSTIPLTYAAAYTALSDFPYEQIDTVPDYYFYQDTGTPISWQENVDYGRTIPSEAVVTKTWNLTDAASFGANKSFNLQAGKDNVIYVGFFCETMSPYDSLYDIGRLVLRIGSIDYTGYNAFYEGGFISGTHGPNLGVNSYKVMKFVITAEELAKYTFSSGNLYFELGFYDYSTTTFVGAAKTFNNILFRSLKTSKWVSFFRESAVRKAILPRIKAAGLVNTAVTTFNKVAPDNTCSPLASISVGSVAAGGTLNTNARFYMTGTNTATITGFKLTRPIGTIAAAATDFTVTINGHVLQAATNTINNGEYSNTTITSATTTSSGTLLSTGSFGTVASTTDFATFNFAVAFKPTVKSGTVSANTRTLTIQVMNGATVLKSINIVGVVI